MGLIGAVPALPMVPAIRGRRRWNRVRNGLFTDNRIWSYGTGWAAGTLQAVRTAQATQTDIKQPVTLVVGATYRLTYTMTRTSGSGALTPRFEGGTNVPATARTASGTYTDVLVAVTGNNTMSFNAAAAFAGTLSRVWLERVG